MNNLELKVQDPEKAQVVHDMTRKLLKITRADLTTEHLGLDVQRAPWPFDGIDSLILNFRREPKPDGMVVVFMDTGVWLGRLDSMDGGCPVLRAYEKPPTNKPEGPLKIEKESGIEFTLVTATEPCEVYVIQWSGCDV